MTVDDALRGTSLSSELEQADISDGGVTHLQQLFSCLCLIKLDMGHMRSDIITIAHYLRPNGNHGSLDVIYKAEWVNMDFKDKLSLFKAAEYEHTTLAQQVT